MKNENEIATTGLVIAGAVSLAVAVVALRAALVKVRVDVEEIGTSAHCTSKAGPIATPTLDDAWGRFDRLSISATGVCFRIRELLARTCASYAGKTVIGVEELDALRKEREEFADALNAISLELAEKTPDRRDEYGVPPSEMAARVAELRKDWERIDWLDRNKIDVDRDGPGVVLYNEKYGLGSGICGQHKTLRLAIDVAIAAQKEGKS